MSPEFHLFSNGPHPDAPCSHVVETDGRILLTNPEAPNTALPTGIILQTTRVMENLAPILSELGLDLSHLLQWRCHLIEFERDFAAFNEYYQKYFPVECRPARSTIGVTALSVRKRVEIDRVARRP